MTSILKSLVALIALSSAACLVRTAPGPGPVVYEEGAPPPAAAPVEQPPAHGHAAPPPAHAHAQPAATVLRVKEIRADRVYARVIYAKEVKATGGRVGRIFEDRDDETWERGRGDGKVEGAEIHADVIYAKEIKANWVEASEIHAKEVKIGH